MAKMVKGVSREPVAIIGLGLRLPGADVLDAFWEHLAAERSLISKVPSERWDREALQGDPAKGQKTNSIWGGFIEDADCFDAEFFGISPREAAWMDPQQRFALEMAWHAIEDAGYRASSLAGSRTGVFMGVCHWDYAELLEKHLAKVDAYTPTGIAFSIIANRISHFFDFQGPSITNDTACAASMTSLYEAVRAIQDGTCDLALAGGVNLIWSPNHFVAFSKAGMLSKDGRGKAFDDAADGYVRGEGGAVLLLKPLSQAVKDGDPVHAVIRGIGINHGGRTNSLTVTNPAAQADLIAQVYRDAEVGPDSIDYIEAHGPGTPLGDPIEISGLKLAFAALSAENKVALAAKSCGVGSVKTNIGHLEGAAGVAGIVKVLAALKHDRLPANVGFKDLNRLIDLSDTPFRIQQDITDWPRIKGRQRRAGVSSFGFGGSNGHIVLEEAPPRKSVPTGKSKPALVVPLSARNETRLVDVAAQLLRYVEDADHTLVSLADIASTYQSGREPMDARCAFVVEDLNALVEALRACTLEEGCAGRVLPEGVEQAAGPKAAKEISAAQRWAAGEDVDWPVRKTFKGRRVHVPVYPFERQRHWMDLSLDAKDQSGVPHPLLHRNTSELDGSRFKTRLSGDEFVLADHHVGGEQVLPGVACLEMARAATALSGNLPTQAFAIDDVVWVKPIQRRDRHTVTIETTLQRHDGDRIGFSIRTLEDPDHPSKQGLDNRASSVANTQGLIQALSGVSPTVVDLDAIKGRMTQSVEAQTCYDRLRDSGVFHGAAFRALAQVSRGDGEALALLKLPRRLLPSLAEMPLHPVLLDAAIQAWIAIGDEAPTDAAVPFACRRVEVYRGCDAVMWAHVRIRPGVGRDASIRHLDIDLVDKNGERCVVLHDLALRVLKSADVTARDAQTDASEQSAMPLIVAQGDWQAALHQIRTDRGRGQNRVLLVDASADMAATLEQRLGWTVTALPDVSQCSAPDAADRLFVAVHQLIGEILQARPTEPVNLLVLATDTVPACAVAPLVGLLKTAAIETPKITGRVITVSGEVTPDRLSSTIFAEAFSRDAFVEVRYDATGTRSTWLPVSQTAKGEAQPLTINAKGVYWITGGLGALGLLFTEWLVAKGARKLVLTGRRAAPDSEGLNRLQDLREKGAEATYLACDVANLSDVENVAAQIVDDHGPLKGIIHAAGVLDDGYILTQDAAKAAGVFAPKVAGTINLDRATRPLPLDFFVLCSSIASVFGNAGQAVYAAANAFMDTFAEERAADVAAGKGKGRTVAIAWPLWKDGGMSVDTATLDAMKRRLGLTPMPTDVGLAALETILTTNATPRSTVLHGDLDRIDEVLVGFGRGEQEQESAAPQEHEQALDAGPHFGGDHTALTQKTIDYVRGILADVLEMDAARIRANRKLEEYGLDSIAIVESTNRMEEGLGTLSKTLFFEYVDLEGLAGHLVEEHGAALRALFAEEETATAKPVAMPAAMPAAMTAPVYRAPADVQTSAPGPQKNATKTLGSEHDDRHDIAIVGLSLHVSQADDQEAFWKMLSEGIDGFEPVPSQRWDNGALHHGERDMLGKTVVKTGAFLPDIEKFDPRYFRISQAEAELMSPEVRLFLQASVEAFEDAGYSRETMTRRHDGDVAVIVGSMTNEYDLYGFQSMLMRGSLASGSYTGTVPNMVSYYYGFTGPSYFLDTMCSAASTCIHEAVHMLRAGRCQMALAGGVNLLLHPQKLIATSQEHFTTKSADVIRGYGLGAEGTILGEGVGALVLKPRVDAERDGDHIYGVITGTGISNAGVRNGFTVPNPNQQAAAIEHALEDAAISPKTISYIEGHGSGTALGDPIEIKALTQVFRKHTDDVQTCPIGTVKSNVAHLLGASGLAGMAKVIAQLKHGQLAPSLHAETLNPDIPFQASPFYVQRELSPWPRLKDEAGRELPRRAGVTSIGAGGMNSHIIVEEYREPERLGVPDEAELLVFSALTPDRLRAVLLRFSGYLNNNAVDRFADIAFTLQVGKNELTSRLALVARDKASALASIEAFLSNGDPVSGMVYVPSILECDPPEDQEALRADCAERRLDRVAAAWCAGAAVDWHVFNRDRNVRRVSLPAYPFDKVHCWYQAEPDAPSVINPIGARSKLHPFVGVNGSDIKGLRYKTTLHLKELRDYVYLAKGRAHVIPTVAAEIVAATARISGVSEHPIVRNLRIHMSPDWAEVKDLNIAVEAETAASGRVVQIDLVTQSGQRISWLTANVSDAGRDVGTDVGGETEPTLDLAALRQQAVEVLDAKAVYEALNDRQLNFGPYIESIQDVWRMPDGGLVCNLRDDQPQQDFFKKNTFCSAPALGAAYEALILAAPELAEHTIGSIEDAQFTNGDISHVYCRTEGNGQYSLQFSDGHGRVVVSLSGVALAEKVAAKTLEAHQDEVAPQVSTEEIQHLRHELREKAATILKFAPLAVGLRDAFYDLGFDSISLTRYANDIGAAYAITLSPAIFFECEHIEALADHLMNRRGVTPQSTKPGQGAIPAVSANNAAKVVSAARLPELTQRPIQPLSAPRSDAPLADAPPADDRVAIIGMAGRFPQSPDVDSFFDHLLAGRDLTSDLPMERYSATYGARIKKSGIATHGGFLEDVDRFDAAFFKVSPVEAERMDPQQRLLLESTWRLLEDAGYTPEELPQDTGVFIGISLLDYANVWRAEGLATDGYVATGNSLAMTANRLSHQFDLKGPSQAIDTACSSSLVAMLRARDALRSGQCSAAIVGGVNLCLSLEGFEGPHQAGMLSPSGHCNTFGRAADGYARGEGVATLLLKPLVDAQRDGDRILGVIAGGAENHGGRSGALTAPNAKAQARLIVDAMTGIDPRTVSYIEAHGTGTELGDPVEINGLRRAYDQLLAGEQISPATIGLGTVKSNIGHLEAAAGIAGVIKVLMAMRRGELPPTLNSQPLNPHVDLDGSPFKVVTQREPWPTSAPSTPRRAGVSSFGFGGANAHVVLESYDMPGGQSRRPLAPRRFASTRFWIPTSAALPGHAERAKMLFALDWNEAEAKGPLFTGRRLAVGCAVKIAEGKGADVLHLDLAGKEIGAKYMDAARQLLAVLRREMTSVGPEDILIQLAVPADGEGSLYSGLGGMLLSACAEDPLLKVQVLEVPAGSAPEKVADWLREEASAPSGSHSRYTDGLRSVRSWRELGEDASVHRWRDGGVYLIGGAMGGLGRIVAEDIARTAKGAVLVLAGSKPIDDERAAFLKFLRSLGAVTAYRQVDMADVAEVKALVDHSVEVHGRLNGVVHCAGVLRDGYIAMKSAEDLRAVLAPKVDGVVALRDACIGLELDAFVLFSSLAGPFGNPGQADYAAANGFLDALARSSNGGITSINWPLWQDGGMSVDPSVEEAFFTKMGQRPLESAAGLAALHQCLISKAPQIAVVGGDENRIRTFFAVEQTSSAAVPRESGTSAGSAAPTKAKLSALFARISGLAESSIDPKTPLEDYGIDSLMITKLNAALGDVFEALPKTLFFRHRTLDAVSDYLVEAQPAACARWTGGGGGAGAQTIAEPVATSASNTSQVISPVTSHNEPIAIIGISGAYPDAPDLDVFWQNLLAGHDAVREIPQNRWPLEGFFEPDPDEAAAKGKSYSKWGAFLDGFADFDPLFFKLSPREAAAMDPQERLFLTTAWQALEDAGYTRERLKKGAGSNLGGARVGVFAGVTKTGYARHGPFRTEGGVLVRPSTSFAGLANRVSHVLDLSGPSLPIDTMCSSSLTAIHEACEHLRSGSCTMAIAGGVNLYLHPSNYEDLSASHMLSPTGRCRSFGDGADGFVPGEGVGCVLLKPLSRAQADGDRIHALIRGSAVNHGGRTNGYTVPNPTAQKDVVRAALDQAGLSARTLSYVEAHGTGTDLGDPIEVDGLTQAFEPDTPESGFCALGSVKSAIGHLEAAAGIAGLTKVVLQMKNATLVASLHSERLNPNIDLAQSPFTLQQAAAPWVCSGPRRAGLSSFGAGGANAHIILEEWSGAEANENVTAERSAQQLVLLSARDSERLTEYGERLLAFVRNTQVGEHHISPLDTSAVTHEICAQLGSLLDVDQSNIDPQETFDALGLEASHVFSLTKWIGACYGYALSPASFDLFGSVAGLVAVVCANSDQGTKPAGLNLADVAYTLQVGRESMDCRIAIVARNSDELADVLEAWLSKSDDDLPIYVGPSHDRQGLYASLNDDEASHDIVARAWETQSLETIAKLWVEGFNVSWHDLRRTSSAQIVSLPTYPFARTRYWIPERAPDNGGVKRTVEARVGDVALQGQLETLEANVARVLQAVLRDIADGEIVSNYRPWADAAKGLLAKQPVVHETREQAWAAWDIAKLSGQSSAEMALAEAALRALLEIVTGKRPATDVLFPDGRQTLVEGVYKDNRIAARFSKTLADVAAQCVGEWDRSRKLRILEIGAGTGGTSEPVFAALAPYADRIEEYAYTDVSRAFLIHAQRAYVDRVPGLTTTLFDVEKPLADQGLEKGRYDLVIAANVLHATADIQRTLARVRETMTPGGVLLLNETSKATLFTHVTFGLLDGWWRSTDPERRIPGTPSLTPESWRHAMEQTGFDWIVGSGAEERALGQQIIVARANAAVTNQATSSQADNADVPEPVPVFDAERVGPASTSQSSLQNALLGALADTLNVSPDSIHMDRSFSDYGLDSILGAEFVHRLRKALNIEIDQTALFDFTSVARLEHHLRETFPQAIAELTQIRPVQHAAAETQQSDALRTDEHKPGRDKRHEPMAIVGASGRFAKSDTIDALWEHLKAGEDLVEPVSRFDLTPFYRDAEPGSYGRHGSFLDAIDRFDPTFFGISGVEATYMDPQQRLFLEEAWKTFENAGHAGDDMIGRRCGVFVGCAHGDYQELFSEQPPGQAFWGNTTSLIPARISYWLDLKGPAVAVDTACSSSLVALHMACQSIRNGDCEMALAGGVFVQCSPRFYRYANAAQMLSPTGRCAAFGAGADGIVPGEAVGAVLIRPLADALADGDTVLGVIAGSGINQDGTTNGITAPSAASQERLIRQVYADFGIDPATIDLVEAHGTGTVLGDPIEHVALVRAYSGAERNGHDTYLGSVKSNIGHATTAAGIAGLAKVLWSLKHETIPPTAHFAGGNPAIDFAKGPFVVNDQAVSWPHRSDQKRRAAISSFGFSGTNAHVVVDEAPEQSSSPEPAGDQLFVLSARTAEQLKDQAKNLADHLEASPELLPEDVAFTLIAGRRHFKHRLVLVAAGLAELETGLKTWLAGEPGSPVETGEAIDDESKGHPAVSNDGARADELRALGRAYLSGGDLDARGIFSAARRRVPLPTYPFATKSYWVVSGKPGKQDVAHTEPPAKTSEGVSCAQVKLAAPTAMTAAVAAADGLRSDKVVLSPLGGAQRQQGPAGDVRRRGDENGVRTLDLSGTWDRALTTKLTQELRTASFDEKVRAVILTGDTAWQASAQAVEGFDPGVVVTCAVPVVASVGSDASGVAAATALLCDFLVVAETARVEDVSLPSSQCDRRLYEGRVDGAMLGDIKTGIRRVPVGQEEDTARTLAGEIAQGPREALTLLKHHMRQALPLMLADLPEADFAPDVSREHQQAFSGASRKVVLNTEVIDAELYDDGVVLLTMMEREGRNMFTPALMDGLEEAFTKVAELAEAKVVVLTGHGSYFACGGTADGLADLQNGDSHFTDRRIYSLPLACDLPVVAAMQGHGIGAGWSLGMYCDQAIFAAEGVYHSNYLWYGFTPGAGATLIFPYGFGDDLGREILFTARQYRGRELGQRSRNLAVCPTRDVLQVALATAHERAIHPRAHLVAQKKDRVARLRRCLDAVLEKELAMHEKTFIGNADVRARIVEKFGALDEKTAPAAPFKAAFPDPVALRADLISSLADDLMIDRGEIGDGDSFLELGLDSILAVTWIRNLNKRFAIALPATAVYAHPTVGALTAHVMEQVAGRQGADSAAVDRQQCAVVSAPSVAATPQQDQIGTDHRKHFQAEIVSSLAEALMIDADEIADTSEFQGLGLDSILAVTWIRSLNTRFAIELPATAVYAHPTVGALVDHVAGLVPCVSKAPQAPADTATPDLTETLQTATPQPNVPVSKTSDAANEAIAIIGASGKFPKAGDLGEFWQNIRSGRDCIDEVPASRWEIGEYYDPDPQKPGKTYCKWMGALDDVGAFDARFFNITPREAELMDPQQRLFLETAWHAIEDAALDPAHMAGTRCGVYVASGPSGYEDRINEHNTYSLLGRSGSILAARISYLLDLRGPCLSIDTACSSSLVAVAQACESLMSGNCDMALAGGASVLFGPDMFIDMAKVSMLSADGRCFTFDERANGFVPGEGVGAVMLKRLSDAERDGDPIHAVIKGWGINQDGRTNGITAPNPQAQTSLLKGVYARFDIDPASIGLIECHGTGTPLGDPIEVEGLTDAFASVAPSDLCAIGSVKSNVGHLLASAGIAGTLKAMLSLENQAIPPSINLETLNGHIPFARTPFAVSRSLSKWDRPATTPRRAGVSAFGFSGTNAHLVLEEYETNPSVAQQDIPRIFVLSARNRERLLGYVREMERFISAEPELSLDALAHTLQVGRASFQDRIAFIFTSRDDLLGKLASVGASASAGKPLDGVHLSAGDAAAVALFDTDDDAKALVGTWLRSGAQSRLDKAAELWAKGLTIDWPNQHAGGRIHMPGYPFERTEYWVEPSEKSPQVGVVESQNNTSSLLGVSPLEGEVGRMKMSINGDAPFLTTHTNGEERLMLGLFLPEMARSVVERLSGKPVRRLGELLWGRPASINGKPRDLEIIVQSDAEGLLYRIDVDGEEGRPCHLGSVIAETDPSNGRKMLATPDTLSGERVTQTFREFAERCAIHSDPPSPEMATVQDVYRDGDVLLARIARLTRPPRGSADDQADLLFDPFVLDAVWRLLSFRVGDWMANAGTSNALSLPHSLEAITSFAALGDQAIVKIFDGPGAPDRKTFTVELYDGDGQECLRLEGLRLTKLEDIREISISEEGPSCLTN